MIEDVKVRSAADPHITYSMYYAEFDAAVAAGATLDELLRLETFPKWFRAKLVAWHNLNNLIYLHGQDAAAPKKR